MTTTLLELTYTGIFTNGYVQVLSLTQKDSNLQPPALVYSATLIYGDFRVSDFFRQTDAHA
jgi:hypothetical protein